MEERDRKPQQTIENVPHRLDLDAVCEPHRQHLCSVGRAGAEHAEAEDHPGSCGERDPAGAFGRRLQRDEHRAERPDEGAVQRPLEQRRGEEQRCETAMPAGRAESYAKYNAQPAHIAAVA